MFKKMMLVTTITSLLIPFFNNTSIVVNNYKTINFSRDSNYNLKLTVNGSCNTNGFQLFCEVI